MDLWERARLAELSEARAYVSLVQCPAAGAIPGDFFVRRVGTAWAMISPAVTGTLNFNRVIGLGLEHPTSTDELVTMAALAVVGVSPADRRSGNSTP